MHTPSLLLSFTGITFVETSYTCCSPGSTRNSFTETPE